MRPTDKQIVRFREMAESGKLYTDIQRQYPQFTVDQVRHCCLGHTGKDVGGPIQEVGRWDGSNVWLRGDASPHARLTEAQAKKVLRSKKKGADLAREFGVAASTIYMLRRGETWKHLPR